MRTFDIKIIYSLSTTHMPRQKHTTLYTPRFRMYIPRSTVIHPCKSKLSIREKLVSIPETPLILRQLVKVDSPDIVSEVTKVSSGIVLTQHKIPSQHPHHKLCYFMVKLL